MKLTQYTIITKILLLLLLLQKYVLNFGSQEEEKYIN